ncbi:hypothetical protein [Gordonia sp. p3-SID1431]|uniref:hypothetical protein n=1 Tax=Gordonia sp. p3-SID1431 TaxID=2916159 RepID=UPI0021A5F335|nr:hypothetical protein [Gordonia sp. p3-SID1431]MCT1352227.1 hypothetical protein [Gordonia sp. p3-SID1431]
MSRTAFHEQAWCETCQAADRSCSGEHNSAPMSTPLTGAGWHDTDYGAELPRIDVFTIWAEYEEDHGVPAIYVAAVSPRGLHNEDDRLIQGYLPLDLAEHLRDSLTTAIDNARLTLSSNHHLLCDCGDERG